MKRIKTRIYILLHVPEFKTVITPTAVLMIL